MFRDEQPASARIQAMIVIAVIMLVLGVVGILTRNYLPAVLSIYCIFYVIRGIQRERTEVGRDEAEIARRRRTVLISLSLVLGGAFALSLLVQQFRH
jgi:hypothetical protein